MGKCVNNCSAKANYSFYPEVQAMAANMYPSLIRSEYSQLQYATFLRLIVESPEDGGVLWHCFQGKDRTGWGAAFLLSALGVDREAIIADFDLSNTAYRELVAVLNAQIEARGGGDAEKEVIRTNSSSPPTTSASSATASCSSFLL